MTPEEARRLVESIMPCTCHEAYTSRGMVDHSCARHEYADDLVDAMTTPPDPPKAQRGSYCKRPVVVEAVQWTRTSYDKATRFLDGDVRGSGISVMERWRANGLIREGDWIIQHGDGRHSSLRPADFAATYEPAADSARQGEPEGARAVLETARRLERVAALVGRLIDLERTNDSATEDWDEIEEAYWRWHVLALRTSAPSPVVQREPGAGR